MTLHHLVEANHRALARFACTAVLLACSSARAALTWDNSGPTDNWSTAGGDTNWLPGNVVWTQGEDAIFGAPAEAVSVTTANTVDDITFGASWTIGNGGGDLTLADANSDMTVTNAGNTATIAESIAGTGFGITKLGAGTLSLTNGSNSYTGGTILSAGILSVGTSGVLGAGTLTLSGGTRAGTFGGATSNAVTVTTSTTTTLQGGGGAAFLLLSGDISGSGTIQTASIGGNVRFSGNNASFNGTMIVNDGLFLNSVNSGSASAVWQVNGGFGLLGNVSGGTFHLGALTGGGGLQSGNGAETFSIGALNTDTTFSGTIINGGGTSITKVGTGKLILSGLNTYAGATTVTSGTLLANTTVSGTNSATGTGAVSVGSTGTLGGTGQITPTGANGISVVSGGIIAPGASIGTLTVNLGSTTGTVSMASGSDFQFELGTPNPTIGSIAAGSSDLLFIQNAAANDLAFNGNNIDLLGTASGLGFYKLFDTSASGTSWANLTTGAAVSGGNLITGGLTVSNFGGSFFGDLILADGSAGTSAGDIYLQVVPEPSSLAMLLFGGVMLWIVRQKRSV